MTWRVLILFDSLDSATLTDGNVGANFLLSNARAILDIELNCLDGVLHASSHILAANSVVFEKMLFAAVQMQEAKTRRVSITDVIMSDIELLLQFCRPQMDYPSLLKSTTVNTILSVITVAHRFEFEFALPLLCKRLIQLVPLPTALQIQFADRYELVTVLHQWAVSCAHPMRHRTFISELPSYPLAAATASLFLNEHFEQMMMPKCMVWYLPKCSKFVYKY